MTPDQAKLYIESELVPGAQMSMLMPGPFKTKEDFSAWCQSFGSAYKFKTEPPEWARSPYQLFILRLK